MIVYVPHELHRLIMVDFMREGSDYELAWGLFGLLDLGKAFHVFCGVRCEKNATATSCDFDHEKLMRAAEILESKFNADFLGIVHSHPEGRGFPSYTDLKADNEWLQGNDCDAGLFGIVSQGGFVVDLNWFILENKLRMYYRPQVTLADPYYSGEEWQAAVSHTSP